MSKEYIPKQFTPFIYPEWGELFDELSDNQNAEILKAITKYPNYEPVNIPVWKFIKSQLQKDYENFKAKCKKRGEASRTYWGNKGEQMISNDIKSLSKDNKDEPKPLTINHLPLIETETKTKKIDIYVSPEIEQIKQIYSDNCKNLIPINSYSLNRELRLLIAEYLQDTNFDYEYFKKVCKKANKLQKIGDYKIDLKSIIKNHSGIYADKYAIQEEKEYVYNPCL